MPQAAGIIDARCEHGARRITCDLCTSEEMWRIVELQATEYDTLAAAAANLRNQLDAALAVNDRLIEENQWLHARLREEET